MRKERSESEALTKSLRYGAALKSLEAHVKRVEADNDALYVQLAQAKRDARAARDDATTFRGVNAALQGQMSELRLQMSGQVDGLVAGLVASDSGVDSADADADTATFGINTANGMPTDTTAVTSHISIDDKEALAAARAQIARLEETVKGYIGLVIEALDDKV